MTKLFKFIAHRDAVTKLAAGNIKFTPPDQLNDPAELLPIVDEADFKSSLRHLRRSGYTQDQFDWLLRQERILEKLAPGRQAVAVHSINAANSQIQKSVYDDWEQMRELNAAAVALIRERVGVLSLTERFDSLPMWAHYADNAKGFLVEFDRLDRAFTDDGTGVLNCLRPVRYATPVPGVSFDPATQQNLFFCKLQDWAYEAEWRVVAPLSECTPTGNGLFLQAIAPSHVVRVICGWNVPTSEVASLRDEMGSINPEIRVLRSAFNGGRLSFEPGLF